MDDVSSLHVIQSGQRASYRNAGENLQSPGIRRNKICNIYRHVCTFAAPSSDSNIALDFMSGCVIGGLSSCMC